MCIRDRASSAAAAAEEAREERRRAREAAVAAAIARDREELERRFAIWSTDAENAPHPFEDARDDHAQLAEACARWGALLAEMAPERFEDHCVKHLGVLAQRVEDLKKAWKEAESTPNPTPWRNVVTGGGVEIDVRFRFALRPLRSGLPGLSLIHI